MNTLTVLAVLAHLVTLGRAGPFSRLFCHPRCNPNPKEPLSQCFFKCGFLQYGKYYDGSVCWYFSRLGQAFKTTGSCSQGICLKIFTSGYNGSEAQRRCGDIPKDAPWLKNITQSSQGPAFNLSDETQQTQTQINEMSTSGSQTALFQQTTTATPPATTAMSLEKSTLSYGGVTTTPVESTLPSTAYTPTEAPGSTGGATTGQEPATVQSETGILKTNIKEPPQNEATTDIPVDVWTTTGREPERATLATIVSTTAASAYAEKPITRPYPESNLNTLAHRPPVIPAQYAASESNTGENWTEENVSEFSHPIAETTVAPTAGYSVTEMTQDGRLNGTETNEGTTEQPISLYTPPPAIKQHLLEPTGTAASEMQETESRVNASAAVVSAGIPSYTHTENASAPLMPTTAEGTTKPVALGPELPVSSSGSPSSKAPGSQFHTVTRLEEVTTENALGTAIATSALWDGNKTTTEHTTPASLLEHPSFTATSDEANATIVMMEATRSTTDATVSPFLEIPAVQTQTNATSPLKFIPEALSAKPKVHEIPSPLADILNITEPASIVTEPSTTETSRTETSTEQPSQSDEGIESLGTVPTASEIMLGGTNGTGTNLTHTTEKPWITTETPLEHLATSPVSKTSYSDHTPAGNEVVNPTRGFNLNMSVTKEPISSVTSEPSITSETANGTLVVGAATEKPASPETLHVSESAYNLTQVYGSENVTISTLPTPASIPTAMYQTETPVTTAPKSTHISTSQAVTEKPTAVDTTSPGSESWHFTEHPYFGSPNVAAPEVTSPVRTPTTAHQNETVYVVTPHPTSPTVAEAAAEQLTLRNMTLPPSGLPVITEPSDVLSPTSTPINSVAPVSTILIPSHQNETVETMSYQPASTEEVRLGASTGGAFNATLQTVVPDYTRDEFQAILTVTRTPVVQLSDHTPKFVSHASTERTFLTAHEPSSLATVPAWVVTGGQTAQTLSYTTSTTGYRIAHETTTEIPVSGMGTLITKETIARNETSTYISNRTVGTSTATEENGAATERPLDLRNTIANESMLTMEEARRSEQNKAAARVPWHSLVIPMAIIIARF